MPLKREVVTYWKFGQPNLESSQLPPEIQEKFVLGGREGYFNLLATLFNCVNIPFYGATTIPPKDLSASKCKRLRELDIYTVYAREASASRIQRMRQIVTASCGTTLRIAMREVFKSGLPANELPVDIALSTGVLLVPETSRDLPTHFDELEVLINARASIHRD